MIFRWAITGSRSILPVRRPQPSRLIVCPAAAFEPAWLQNAAPPGLPSACMDCAPNGTGDAAIPPI